MATTRASSDAGLMSPKPTVEKTVVVKYMVSMRVRPSAVKLAGDDVAKGFKHISTGGGASLELIEGKKLPGVEALRTNAPLSDAPEKASSR